MAQGLQGGVLKVRWEAEALEPIDEVVSQQEQMEVRLVGKEVTRGDAAQGIVALELFDQQLDASAIVVEAPEVERLQGEVGDEDLVVIPTELEERQLFGGLLRWGRRTATKR